MEIRGKSGKLLLTYSRFDPNDYTLATIAKFNKIIGE